MLGVRPLELAEPWAELEAARLLREDRLVYDLLAEAILSDLPVGIVQHLHREIARVLEARGGDPTAIALHWEAGARPEEARRHALARGGRRTG